MLKLFQRTKHLLQVIALTLFICGCSDVLKPLEVIRAAGDAEVAIEPVPAAVADLIWGDEDALRQTMQEILENQPNAPVSGYLNRIAMIQEQKAYYQKYIDAGGIAIMGSDFLEDAYFYAARAVVLRMTAKRPDLRKHLTPIREQRPLTNAVGDFRVPRRTFRLILSHPEIEQIDIPEVRSPHRKLGWCTLDKCLITMQRVSIKNEIHTGFLIHEFAHALHLAINLIDPTFNTRLRQAYAAAVGNPESYWGGGGAALSGSTEYWAFSVTRGFTRFALPTKFGEQHHTRFRERDPLMYELLAEYFDFVYLGEGFYENLGLDSR